MGFSLLSGSFLLIVTQEGEGVNPSECGAQYGGGALRGVARRRQTPVRPGHGPASGKGHAQRKGADTFFYSSAAHSSAFTCSSSACPACASPALPSPAALSVQTPRKVLAASWKSGGRR